MKKFIEENILDKNGKIYSKKTTKEWFVKSGFEKEYEEIENKTSFLSNPSFSQRAYHIFHDIDSVVLCQECHQNTPIFDTFIKGYRRFCSSRCSAEHTKEQRKETMIDKYGGYPFCMEPAVEKRKQTCIEKYGVEYPFQNKEIQDKQTLSMIATYGVDNPSKLQAVKDKKIQTCLSNWGTEHPLQCDVIQNKVKQYNLENYGVEHFFETDVFKDKIKNYTFPSQSSAEIEICEYIKSIINCEIEQGSRSILNGKELDIYIKDKNLAIEYCGLYWHSNKFRHNTYHKEKFVACQEKGIRLITIFEDEWANKKDLIKTKLSHILNANKSEKVFARNCSIKLLSNKDKSEFYEKYHIQGSGKSSIHIGLYYKKELVSCMSFKQRSKDVFELDRYATKYVVIGGFNKLLEHFKKNFDWNKIITFADLRWHLGNVYINSGFEIESILSPDYSYIINNKRIHKFNFRKSLIEKKFPDLYDKNLSESENMKNIGILKVYDCGKIKFTLNRD